MSNATIVWANDLNGVARYILEVQTGLDCNCVCPGCGARLEAVNAQNPYWKKRPHFRHYQAPELEDCATSAVLTAAKEIVKTITELKLPSFEVTQDVETPSGRKFTGKAKVTEEVVQVTAAEFVDSTDAILTLADGQKIRLRLVATARRSSDPTEPVMGEIAIDLTDPVLQTADPETLREHITLTGSARRWCHFADAQALERLALADANAQWETFVARTPTPPPENKFQFVVRPEPKLFPPSQPAKQHVPVSDMAGSLRSLNRRDKVVSCYWCASPPDTSKWGALISTWRAMFGEQYYDLLDAAITARDANQNATEALTATANAYGYSPQAIAGLWSAAQIAVR